MTVFTQAARRGVVPITSAVVRQDVHPGAPQRAKIEAGALNVRRFPFDLTDGTISVVVDVPEPVWLYSVLGKLQGVDQLGPGWDSYDGAPLTFEAALASLDFLSRYLPESAIEPSIVPSSTGGLQLEWHRKAGDLEVTFSPDGSFAAFFSDAKSGTEWEMAGGEISASELEAAVTAVSASYTE